MASPRTDRDRWTDHDLLRAHVERPGDGAAFAELVDRHADLVYAAACRMVGGRGAMADDVTQATFILLSRKAGRIPEHVVVAAWLHKATRYAALNAMKIEHRRRAHERRAGERLAADARQLARPPSGANVDANWAQGAALLDVGIERLGDRDRAAVVLRFLERRSFAEVGAALGVSEEAAQMRVGRAVEKLRGYFRRHGLTVTAATLRAGIDAGSVARAPAALKVALVAAAGPRGGSVFAGHASHVADAAGRAMEQAALRATSLFAAAGVALAIVATSLVLRLVDADVARAAAPAPTTRAIAAEGTRPPTPVARTAPRDWGHAPFAAIAGRVGEILTPRPLLPPVETARREPAKPGR